MNETNRLNVSDIDFESIQQNLKEYMRGQDSLQDYDFEGSALSSMINLLAYVTHYNAVNANLGLNETFLETAQFRGSVVGHARMLGYTPRSASAPVAYVDVSVPSATTSLIIPRGFRFKAKIGNVTYPFVTDTEYRTDTTEFTSIKILQGTYQTAQYVYDADSAEKYLIPSPNADIDTVIVRVYDTRTSEAFEVFNEGKDITTITPQSNVFFVSENPEGLYEITFGDGVIGTSLSNGNLIEIEYLVTQKAAGNGASIFSSDEAINGISSYSITTREAARGGSEKESVDQIKYNAPLSYASQNRAVTPKDFEAIIRENFPNVNSIKAWGGEDNDPPVYGKVFVSINPKTTDVLSDEDKQRILDDILKPRSVVTVQPEIIDPVFTYISLDVFFKYDPTETSETEAILLSRVRDTITQYNVNNLDQFNTVFRHSALLSAVDSASDAILNSNIRTFVKKRFIPDTTRPLRYEIDFSTDLYKTTRTEGVITSSTLFTFDGQEACRFRDVLNSDGDRIIQVVRGQPDSPRIVASNVGRISGSKIILDNFTVQSFRGNYIEIEAIPNSYDIAPVRNNILAIDLDSVTVNGQVDTIVAGQNFSGSNYQTTPRYA
jgi:hypothetical protein